MFKFLKLWNSVSGDARRHVPFTSIIHKHIIPLVLVFIFVLFTSVIPVSAVDIPLPPVWLPMNPYNSDALHNNYVLLNDDQKKIVHEVIGAYGSVFLGLAANPLQNPIDTIINARSWLQEYGSTFLNTFFDSTVQAPRAMQDLVGSVTYKASTYNSYDDYVSDTSPSVSSGSEKYFQFTPELTVAYKNWFAVYGDVYYWQQSPISPSNIGSFNWLHSNMSASLLIDYENYVYQLPLPHVHLNYYRREGITSTSYYNAIGGSNYFNVYCYLFINSANGYIYLVDSNGNHAPSFNINAVTYDTYYGRLNTRESTVIPLNGYSISTFSDINTALDYVFSNGSLFYKGSSSDPYFTPVPNLQEFVRSIFIGASWTDRRPYTMIEDLNIAASPSAYIDNVGDDAFVNINGLIGYLGSDVTDVREGVFENTLVRDGDHAIELTDSILTAIDRAIEETKSGIVIPTDVFSSLFDGGNGFISYMWYMTKPLVIYTRDLLDLLTFDPVNGFNASGPGYFILGVVGLGVIGGVIVKFLL